ncbi:MAG: hypothetical protein ACOCXJ_08245, partial [Planctomycetota bacterium]
MTARLLHLVPAVAIATGPLAAADVPTGMPSSIYNTSSNQHYLQGSLLIDALRQNRYRPGAADPDVSGMWIRAEYGAKIELDDKLELTMTVAYDAEAGDSTEDEGLVAGADGGEVVMDDAWAVFKRFLHPTLDFEVGRMPVAWNLRQDHGAFLYDSRADSPDVTSWDGVRASFDIENWTFRPFYYWFDLINERRGVDPGDSRGRHEDDNYLYGIVVDWQPDSAVDNEIFITAAYTVANNVRFGAIDDPLVGDRITTWSLGTEWKMASGWEIYGEYAQQDGNLDDGREVDARGYYGGATWRVPVGGRLDRAAINLQYDHLDGDDGGSDFGAFINPYEAVSDTLIVEHERYGELSRLLTGNLDAYKTRLEWVFVPRSNFRVQATGAQYNIPDPAPGNDDDFGLELDLEMSWDYNYYTTFT